MRTGNPTTTATPTQMSVSPRGARPGARIIRRPYLTVRVTPHGTTPSVVRTFLAGAAPEGFRVPGDGM
jgi:hypothetical protein